MDIPQLATILASTFDPNLREEAEKKLNEVLNYGDSHEIRYL